MTCPACGWDDVRYRRLLGPALEVVCGLCDESLHVVEVEHEVA
jgi:hypothetical protein